MANLQKQWTSLEILFLKQTLLPSSEHLSLAETNIKKPGVYPVICLFYAKHAYDTNLPVDTFSEGKAFLTFEKHMFKILVQTALNRKPSKLFIIVRK